MSVSRDARAEADAEVDAARKDGTLEKMSRGAPLPPKSVGPGKTRQQVSDEMRQQTPEQRRAQTQQLAG